MEMKEMRETIETITEQVRIHGPLSMHISCVMDFSKIVALFLWALSRTRMISHE